MFIKKALLAAGLSLLTLPAIAAVSPYSTLSGGITSDERMEIDRGEGANYSLKLQFAKPSGELVTDVAISVRDSNGKEVINQRSEGPYFLIALPTGSYMVTARADGETKMQNVDVKGGVQKSYTLRFNAP